MTLEISEAVLSDLFFNYEKPLLDEELKYQMDSETQNTEAIQVALQKEAKEFSQLLGGQIGAKWFIDNYNIRL
jgi:hypothetical protein